MAHTTRAQRLAYRTGYTQCMTRNEYVARYGADNVVAYEMGTVDGMVYADYCAAGANPADVLRCTVNTDYMKAGR